MNAVINMSRRDFIRTCSLAGGGLILGTYLPLHKSRAFAQSEEYSKNYNPNAFLHIRPDETIILTVNKSEMGQGVYTSIPMLVAEELECDWNMIVLEPAPVAPIYNNPMLGVQGTGGSTSVRSEWDRMRKVGAAARLMLIGAAAAVWKADPADCSAKNSVITGPDGKSLTYGQVAASAADLPVPEKIELKKPADFTIIGRPIARLDTPEKVIGMTRFGLDVIIPGMLTALVAHPPFFGGRVKSFDGANARTVPGVVDVVQAGAGVAVVAENFWQAKKGREALEIIWDEGPNAHLSTEAIREQYGKLMDSPGLTARKEGTPEKLLEGAVTKVSAEYEVPYLAHACMEPLNCVVDLKKESCEIWTGTQFQTVDRENAAGAAGLKPEKVTLNTTYLGGGFGRRANPQSDFVVLAVRVAKAVKKPVKVIWTREDDMKGGYYRPLWVSRLTGGLDKNGSIIAWHHRIAGQSIMKGTPFEDTIKNGIDPSSVEGAADLPYEIPGILVDLHSPETGVPVQWWRSVGHSNTAFVVESFFDELAHAAGKDPYEFRRSLLAGHSRHLGVLDLAAEKAGWGKPLPDGHARGIALHKSFGSFVAQVAEVSVDPAGQVRVHRVVCAVDCGRTVNPDTIEAQMESGIVFGLSAALYEAINIRDGRVVQSNFNDYPVLRMNRMPVVEVHILPSTEDPGGIGEPGTPPIAPAVTNAVFAVTGKRIRKLPFETVL